MMEREMKKSIFTSLFILVLYFSCNREVQIPDEIKETIKTIMDSETYGKNDLGIDIRNVIHPDVNWLGGSMRYTTKIDAQKIKNGTYIFSKSRIVKINKLIEDIGWPNGEVFQKNASFYLVNVEYKVIGEFVKGELKKENAKHSVYWVLLKDDIDSKYKEFDQIPSVMLHYYGQNNKEAYDVNEQMRND
jgi:hypothetical protein